MRAMPKHIRVIAFALVIAGCGGSPSAPANSAFPLAAGAYRLRVTGTGCIVTGGAPGSIDIPVTLTESGAGWELSVPGQSMSGTLASTGTVLTGTIAGTAASGGVEFQTGFTGSTRTLAGTARDGNRFEGDVTGGSVTFDTAGSGSGTAFCTAATFTLRK